MKEREIFSSKENHKKAPLAVLGLFFIASLSAFTKKQRDSIVERDNNECQMPKRHRHKGGLQVHHIIPQRYAETQGLDPDYPENGITLCEEAHVGKDGIHPDIFQAKKVYHEKKARGEDAFKETFEERQRKLNNRKIYWNDEYDRQMSVVAVKRTQEAKKKGWVFPSRRKKK